MLHGLVVSWLVILQILGNIYSEPCFIFVILFTKFSIKKN